MKEYLTIPEAASLLRLGERTTYELARTGRLPGVAKIAGKWLIHRERLLTWLEEGGECPRGRPGARKSGLDV